jgi:cytochrome c oxidase assembly factor CtaG
VPTWRIASFAGAVLLFAVALSPPLESRAEELFSFHMIQHVLLGDLSPLLFVLGLTGPLLRPLLALRPVAALRPLAHPLVALPLWTINLYVWHIPFLYEGAIRHDAVHALEHFCFFTFGCLMWEPVVETLPAPAWFGTGWKMGYVVVVRLLETVLGNVFIWSSSAFYSPYRHVPEWGIAPVHDLNLGGVVMMAEGSIVTLSVLVWLFLKLAAEGETRQRLLEEGYDPRQVSRAVRYGRAEDLSAPR